MIVEFICGCVQDVNLSNPDEIGWWREISTDRIGFMVCAKHRMRRKGWRSIPAAHGKSKGLNYFYAQFSPLQLERHFIFGEPLTERKLDISDDGPDTRDTRDPELVGREIMGKSNGHS